MAATFSPAFPIYQAGPAHQLYGICKGLRPTSKPLFRNYIPQTVLLYRIMFLSSFPCQGHVIRVSCKIYVTKQTNGFRNVCR